MNAWNLISHQCFGNIFLVSLSNQGGKLEWDDYKTINLNQYVCIEKIKTMNEGDLEYLEEFFTTFLPDGKEYDLEIGGKQKPLTLLNRDDYIEKTKQMHLAYLEKPFSMMRRGFSEYLHPYRFNLNTAEDLENAICGMNYVDITVLKSITHYEGFGSNEEEHASVAAFWNILGRMSQPDLASYLKYVWGRARLSHAFGDKHKLTYQPGKQGAIPEAHTCFFELDLADYDSEADLEKKLRYGMDNCHEIAETDAAYRLAADFGL